MGQKPGNHSRILLSLTWSSKVSNTSRSMGWNPSVRKRNWSQAAFWGIELPVASSSPPEAQLKFSAQRMRLGHCNRLSVAIKRRRFFKEPYIEELGAECSPARLSACGYSALRLGELPGQ